MPQTVDLSNDPHRRYNPLIGEWVLVSPHRAKRPWQGQSETVSSDSLASYDPKCYLCPSNTRVNGQINPKYHSTFVFANDFAALHPDTAHEKVTEGLFQYETEQGCSRVICFSPEHNKTLPELTQTEREAVVNCWQKQTAELSDTYTWVQIFENKGAVMGCSNPHPHGQVWAQQHIPTEPAKKVIKFNEYHTKYQRSLLLDYAQQELEKRQRVVCKNEHWLVVVPYWAAWPFETLLLPLFSVSSMAELNPKQASSLADIIGQITTRYDNLFNTSFPYSMGWNSAPFDGQPHPEWGLHAHFYPPLLRSATVRKFMVGYEMMAESQRDLTAEQAASRLRDVPAEHYKVQDNKHG